MSERIEFVEWIRDSVVVVVVFNVEKLWKYLRKGIEHLKCSGSHTDLPSLSYVTLRKITEPPWALIRVSEATVLWTAVKDW